MDKGILREYIDACELIKETEQDIQTLRKKEVVLDKVSGSNPEFPYQTQSFKISGVNEVFLDSSQVKAERALLEQRKNNAKKIKLQVERGMLDAPVRIQRIIRFRFFEGMSWEETADRMGRSATGNGLRMELERFLSKK